MPHLPALERVCEVCVRGGGYQYVPPFQKLVLNLPLQLFQHLLWFCLCHIRSVTCPVQITVVLLPSGIHIHPGVTVLANQDFPVSERLKRE